MTVVPEEEVARQEPHSPCFEELKNKQNQPSNPVLLTQPLPVRTKACLLLPHSGNLPTPGCETLGAWDLDLPF